MIYKIKEVHMHINVKQIEKTNNLGSDQVQLKPGCTVTEDG